MYPTYDAYDATSNVQHAVKGHAWGITNILMHRISLQKTVTIVQYTTYTRCSHIPNFIDSRAGLADYGADIVCRDGHHLRRLAFSGLGRRVCRPMARPMRLVTVEAVLMLAMALAITAISVAPRLPLPNERGKSRLHKKKMMCGCVCVLKLLDHSCCDGNRELP